MFLRFFNSRNERKYSGFVLIYGGPWAAVKLHDLVLFTWSTQTTLRIAREAIKATIRSNFDYGLGLQMKHFHTFQNYSMHHLYCINFGLTTFDRFTWSTVVIFKHFGRWANGGSFKSKLHAEFNYSGRNLIFGHFDYFIPMFGQIWPLFKNYKK